MRATNRTRAGIDYGLGQTNVDHATGIRYGVISQHALADWFYDEWQADYGEPTCPECGDSVADTSGYGDDDYLQYRKHGCADYVCHSCKHTLDGQDVTPDEPIGHSLETDGYKAVDCLHTDVMILASPYYTFGPFCSPCVPGAVSLPDDPATQYDADSGVKAYCFGHDWFEDGKAPYKVYRVVDDSEVASEG